MSAGRDPIFPAAIRRSSSERQNVPPINSPTSASEPGIFRGAPMPFPRRSVVSPSLRLRATAANRSMLRWMRAVELTAWNDSNLSTRRALTYFPQ
jgi:hypothetical protein